MNNKTIRKVKDIVIFQDQHYNTFPNAIMTSSGEIAVAFRQAPDRRTLFNKNLHIDPASKAVFVTSSDHGETWDEHARTIYDDFYYGVQDPCVQVLQDGSLFCTFFTWEVIAKEHVKDLQDPMYREIQGKWMAKLGGVYTIRSVDGGKTWDEPLPMNEGKQGAVRGNCVELEDGSLLLPYYVKGKAFVAVTKDRGKTWETRSTLAAQTDCLFHEPNLYRTASGKLIAFIRTLKQGNDIPDDKRSPLVTCESYDNGQTWVNHKEHPIFSPSPFHILRLQSGNVLLTYGHRLKPYGIRALLLNAECTNLDKAESIILRDDSPGFDIGYTSSVQLVNGEILVTYYYYEEQQELRYIAGTICKEEPLSSFD